MQRNRCVIPKFTAEASLWSPRGKTNSPLRAQIGMTHETDSSPIKIAQNCPPCQPCDPATLKQECFRYEPSVGECISYSKSCRDPKPCCPPGCRIC